ncbi:MAG: hypothetical protein WC886_08865 [Saccharofermentanaceae bacterium]|jgi:hypothetical protein
MSYLNGNQHNPSFNHGAWLDYDEHRRENYGKLPTVKSKPFKFDRNIKHCAYCGNPDHENNLIKCLDKQYRHEYCIEFKEEIYKNMNHENQ